MCVHGYLDGYSINAALWIMRVIITHGTETQSIYSAIGALIVSAGCTYNYQTINRVIRNVGSHYPEEE